MERTHVDSPSMMVPFIIRFTMCTASDWAILTVEVPSEGMQWKV